jgi:UDP-glucose 4-epimerase
VVALVTGAGGFIGRHVCLELEAGGWRVARAGRPEIEIPSMKFAALVERSRPDVLIHCAGPASVPMSLSDPLGDLEGSVLMLANILYTIARMSGSPRLVLVSSAAVYGDSAQRPINEEAPFAPVSPYGFHRQITEVLVEEYRQIFAIPSTVLRIFSAYGEGLRKQLLWDVCRMAVRDGAVTLSGTGAETRDFLHVKDVARAVSLATSDPRAVDETYNIASGVETTVSAVAGWVVDELGTGVPIGFSGFPRPGDPARWSADISKISALGFRPSIEIEAGARAYARWARAKLVSS